MKATLRSHVAAALCLLAPAAATFVATPAVAAPQRAAPAPEVFTLTLNADNGLTPGSVLQVAVEGTPKSAAAVTLGKTNITIPLRETSAGMYRGSYTVKRSDRIDPTSVVSARLTRNKRTTVANYTYPASFQALASMGAAPAQPQEQRADRGRDRDRVPPSISDVTPRNGDIVGGQRRTLISADFDDRGGSGIDPGSVRIRLQGRDVTSEARVTADQFAYRGDLPPGRYTAEVMVRDHAGNSTTKSWGFDVAGEAMGAAPATMLPLTISSPNNGALIDANGNIRVQGRTAPYARVRILVESISPVVGNRLGVAQNVGSETVQADRDGYFSADIDPRGGLPVPGSRYEVTTTATHNNQTAESKVTLNTRS